MGKKSVEMLVGIFVLLGMAGLVFLALKAANLGTFSGGDTYTLRAYFDNIGALKVRAPVRSAGVTVGRVASIKLDPKLYQGVVELAIQRDDPVPDRFVAADPHLRPARRPVRRRRARRSRKMWSPATTIKQTQSAVVLESLISQFLFSKAADAGNTPAPAASAGSGAKK
jgi:phospholipid/cholesterol/gamma-HCH transport system substrate-binding protein